MEETGIKFAVFFSFKKKIDGITRNLVRMVDWFDSLEDASSEINNRTLNANKPEDYYISKYDVTGTEMIKLGEFSVV